MSTEEGKEDDAKAGANDRSRSASEEREELLFKQPKGNHLGDCPICCDPLPYEVTKCALQLCCSKAICKDCFMANLIRERSQKLTPKCPFCREPLRGKGITLKNTMKRIKAKDPIATFQHAIDCHKAGDQKRSFDYFSKAAEWGDADAHFRLAEVYHNRGDRDNERYHLEEASIMGHPSARHSLAAFEEVFQGNTERATRHLNIASKQGNKSSMTALMGSYQRGLISKEELAITLREHKAAVDAMYTPSRMKIEEGLDRLGLN